MRFSNKEQKIEWIAAHPKLWEGWPRGPHGADARHAEIVDAMIKDGLVSPNTGFYDINLTGLIGEARERRRMRQRKRVTHDLC